MATGSLTSSDAATSEERQLELAFLPLHKRAFGTAAGVASALLLFGVTMLHMARADTPYPLGLLAQYLSGYSVSLQGALIGSVLAGIAGFVAGWFFAFCRNLALAASAFIVRTRAELANMREFLDHI